MPTSDIIIKGAREHNLRDVDLVLPRNQLICLTGVSGSGKSSLAFDTLFAEGQRRYVESLSTFARQFLGQMPKPDVDHISGLSPSISIAQKSAGSNPRSTVGTITEIYDFLRLLYARVGQGHCYECQRPITAQSREQIIARILSQPAKVKFAVLAPVVRGQKGEFRDLCEDLLKQGFVRARVDGLIVQLTDNLSLDRQMRHNIEVVIDRLEAKSSIRGRLAEAVELGSDLTDFGRQELVVIHDRVGTPGATGGRARNTQGELAGSEQRHIGVVFVTHLQGLALLDLGDRAEDDFRLLVPVGRSSLVAFAPQLIRPPFGAERGFHDIAVHPRLADAAVEILPGLLKALYLIIQPLL